MSNKYIFIGEFCKFKEINKIAEDVIEATFKFNKNIKELKEEDHSNGVLYYNHRDYKIVSKLKTMELELNRKTIENMNLKILTFNNDNGEVIYLNEKVKNEFNIFLQEKGYQISNSFIDFNEDTKTVILPIEKIN